MNTDKTLETIEKTLKKHNQSHLLAFFEQLSSPEREDLLAQIANLEMEQIDDWVAKYVKTAFSVSIPDNFGPAKYFSYPAKDSEQQEKYRQAKITGQQLISAGKVAAFVVAGGQGTRLGFDGPKGNFHISPVKDKTLFQLFAEMILAASEKYNARCPWYIMTSPLNHAETIQIFSSNNYYGLKEEDIFIFQQGTMPNFSFDGNILMADKATIATSPDGHGGSLKALYKSGAVADMKKRGVEFISYFQVDNPLINIFDPLFVGLHADANAQMSSKALIKTDPLEKVGNFCLVDDKVTVIEYSDLPDEQAQRKNPDGSLVFELGSIAIHIINTSFVEQLNAKGFSLPLHKAVKKIANLDDNGTLIDPKEPNGIKLESFVFDALPLSSESIILQTIRAEEFGPVKNATGTDSAETAKQMITERAATWLEAAGIKIPRKPDNSADCILEIAPTFALNPEDVKPKTNQIPEINPGDKLYFA